MFYMHGVNENKDQNLYMCFFKSFLSLNYKPELSYIKYFTIM